MNHDILKNIIYDRHEVIKQAKICDREYFFEPNANYVLVGLRRAGKSTLMYDIAKKLAEDGVDWSRIIYINFEDDRLTEFKVEDFNDIVEVQSELSTEKGYYFFDEIQIIDGWEKFARRLADAGERVYITGSNAKMLSKEIASTLGGRYRIRFVETYNFREYLSARSISYDDAALHTTASLGRIKSDFAEYLKYGGFPESLTYYIKREYISDIYQKVLLGDIVARNRIRNDYALRILIKKLADAVMNEISYSKLHNSVKSVGLNVSKDSIIEYISYIEDAYLVFDIKNYVAAFAEKESNPKYYFGDNGLLSLFLVNKDSALLENIIAIKLMKEFDDVFYYKSPKTGIDVDFYIPDTGTAIQAAYSIEGEARKREVDNLIKMAKKLEAVKKFMIITYDREETIEENGISIEVVPAYKFLLREGL